MTAQLQWSRTTFDACASVWPTGALLPPLPAFDAAASSNSMLALTPTYLRRSDVQFDALETLCRTTGSLAAPDLAGAGELVSMLPDNVQMYFDVDTMCFFYYHSELDFSSWHRPGSAQFRQLEQSYELLLHRCSANCREVGMSEFRVPLYEHAADCVLIERTVLGPQVPHEKFSCSSGCAVVESTGVVHHAWMCYVLRARGGEAAYHSSGRIVTGTGAATNPIVL